MGYFRILGAIPGFFLSAFLLMLIWGWLIAPQFGIATISYVHSMLITIVLWIAVAPLAATGKWRHK
jgi:ABC-type sugar transport system permease subunit